MRIFRKNRSFRARTILSRTTSVNYYRRRKKPSTFRSPTSPGIKINRPKIAYLLRSKRQSRSDRFLASLHRQKREDEHKILRNYSHQFCEKIEPKGVPEIYKARNYRTLANFQKCSPAEMFTEERWVVGVTSPTFPQSRGWSRNNLIRLVFLYTSASIRLRVRCRGGFVLYIKVFCFGNFHTLCTVSRNYHVVVSNYPDRGLRSPPSLRSTLVFLINSEWTCFSLENFHMRKF